MTDYDRGAYTPQTDAPLAFDPRRPSERRPMPMALIGSGVVLVILLAGVAMVYRGGVRHAGESPRPVGEPVMAVKTAPPAAQTASAGPPANMDVYEEGQSNTTAAAPISSTSNQVAAAPASGPAPAFAPAPEAPAPRPAPKPSTVAMLSRPTAPNHIVRPATPTEDAAASATETKVARSTAKPPAAKPPSVKSTATSEAAAKVEAPKSQTAAATKAPALRPAAHGKLDASELAAAGATRTVADEPAASDDDAAPPAKAKKPVKTAAADDAAPLPAKKAVKTAAAAPAASPAATGTVGGGKAVVQIGAFSSSTLADKGYADVSATLPDRMGGKAKHVQPLDKDGATLYRTWLSGFASRQDAVEFCDALKAKGKTCLVKG